MSTLRRQPYLLQLAMVFAAYFGCGWLGIKLAALPNSSLTLIWLPAGVALGALIIFGNRIWPAIWAGSFASNTPYLIGDASLGALAIGILFGAGAATINTTVQGLLAKRLYDRLTPRGLYTRGDVIRFTFLVVLLPSGANIAFLIPMYALGGFLPIPLDADLQAYTELFFSFSLADLHGYFLIAPLAIAWFAETPHGPRDGADSTNVLVIAVSFGVLLAGALFVFDGIIYLLVPLGVFVILRFGLRGVTAFNVIMSLSLTGATVRGVGPFFGDDPWVAFVTLLLFVFSIGFAGLFLAAQEREIRRARETLEDTVTERTRDLSQALAAKDELLATVNHELRNPLHAILGLTQLIHRDDLPPKAAERTALIARAGDQVLARVNAILDFVRSSGAPPAAAQTTFHLPALLDEMRQLADPEAIEPGGRIRVEIADGTAQHIEADADRIGQILLNLLSNAVKYGAGSDITIAAATTDQGDGNLRLAVTVTDQGPGIDPANHAAIFEEFRRLDENPEHTSGSGLGLAICRRLAESLGGSVTVETPSEGGAKFQLALNVRPGTPADAEVSAPHPQAPNHRARVLLVEDDQLGRLVTTDLLASLGHTVVQAGSAERALVILADQDVDAIITDIGLPGITGTELARQLRHHENPMLRGMPIAAMTASIFLDRNPDVQGAGFNAVFVKPVNLEDLATFLGDTVPAIPQTPTAATVERLNKTFVDGELAVIGLEKFEELIAAYEAAMPGLLRELDAAIDADDAEMTAAKLHRIAGMSSNLGLSGLQLECAGLENNVTSGSQQPGSIDTDAIRVANADDLAALREVLMAR